MSTNAEVRLATKAEVIAAASKLDDVVVIDGSFIALAIDHNNPECPYAKAYLAAHKANETVGSLIADAKQKHIEQLEREYKAFCIHARKTKEQLEEFATDPLFDDEERRLIGEFSKAEKKLNTVIAEKPLHSSFPTDEEIEKWNAKLAAATKALETKQEELQEHRQSQALRVRDISDSKVQLSELVQKERNLRAELDRLKAPQSNDAATLLVLR